MLDFPSKGIFSANQVRVSGHFYDDKPRKLGEKQRLVTTDGRDICMSISDGLAYIPVIFPTDEEMESYHKAPLTPSGEWKPQDLDEDFQWGDFDNDASFGVNISANSYTQSYNDLGLRSLLWWQAT